LFNRSGFLLYAGRMYMEPNHIPTGANLSASSLTLFNKFQVAEQLRIHNQTVLKYTRLGWLECYKLGPRSYRYSAEQINRYLARLATGGKR